MLCCYLVSLNVCVPAVIEPGADGQVDDSLIHTQSKIFVLNIACTKQATL